MNTATEACLLPFNAERFKDKYLVTNRMGCWDALNVQEFRQLNSLQVLQGGKLFERLRERGLILDENNLPRVLEGYRNLNGHVFKDTGLHIAVVTKRCNLRCKYCHAEGGASSEDMSQEVAARVLHNLFDVRNQNITLEFQGGEPLLNWPAVAFLTEHARKFNTLGKQLHIVLVTNMMLMDEAKMRFLAGHDVQVCVSLDGPADIHDQNRIDASGRGRNHGLVVAKIMQFERQFGRKVNLLPTITKHSLAHPERIIDEFVRLGQGEIALRPVNRIGYACGHWEDIGYTAEAFNDFYDRAMAYIMKLNLSGTPFSERIARTILVKALYKQDPGYVDMMNPCGAGRCVMSYAPDGGCYPSDEARMLGDPIFRLGNIMDENLDKMLAHESLLYVLSAGCSDLWHDRSVYSPWMGYDPVVNYAVEGNVIPQGGARSLQILKHQFRTVFAYLLENPSYAQVFHRWTRQDFTNQGVPHEKEEQR